MSDVDTSADKPYESVEEFYEEKDWLMAQHWLDPYEKLESPRTEVATTIAVSIFAVIVVAAVFFAIFWLAHQDPTK